MGKNRKRNNNRQNRKKQLAEVTDSIEAQLDRQRRKRAAAHLEKEEEPKPPQRLGGGAFVYDAKRNAYFPKHTIPQNDQEIKEQRWNDNVRRKTAVPLSYETCTSPKRSRALRASWIGRALTSSMVIEPTMKKQRANQPGWVSLLPQCFGDDFECKHEFAPFQKTFDVLQTHPDKLPCVVTFEDTYDIDDQTVSVRREIDPQQSPIPGQDFYNFSPEILIEAKVASLSLLRRQNRSPLLCMLSNGTCMVGSSFIRLNELGLNNVNEQHTYDGLGLINDCAFFTAEGPKVQAAVAPDLTHSNKARTHPVQVYMDDGGPATRVQDREFRSKSDCICVEYLTDHEIVYGRRNGSIVLFDNRDATRGLSVVAKANRERGSVTSMTPFGDGYSFLAKSSFASCQFYDIRKMSCNKSIVGGSLVYDLHPPRDVCNPTISTCCTGVAVDPSKAFAVSPYADQERQSHFALWSLMTGQLIGTKAIGSQQPAASGLPHCELRSEITSAWQLVEERGMQDDGKFVIRRKKNAWSLWFKSRQVEPSAPVKYGTVHQLTFPL